MSVAKRRYELWLEAEADKAEVFDLAERAAFMATLDSTVRAANKQVAFAAHELKTAARKRLGWWRR